MAFVNNLAGNGPEFQLLAAELLCKKLGVSFNLDYPIAIGHPPKLHRFDLVSADSHYVGECKNYSWTQTGNMPSAKISCLNEAVLYLSHVPHDRSKFIVLRLDRHDKHKETLAQYYLRTYKHLLRGLTFYEIDPSAGELSEHIA
jgi:hypothetical protein